MQTILMTLAEIWSEYGGIALLIVFIVLVNVWLLLRGIKKSDKREENFEVILTRKEEKFDERVREIEARYEQREKDLILRNNERETRYEEREKEYQSAVNEFLKESVKRMHEIKDELVVLKLHNDEQHIRHEKFLIKINEGVIKIGKD